MKGGTFGVPSHWTNFKFGELKMKVFDYTDGTKGRLLADVKMVTGVHGNTVVKDGKRYRVTLSSGGQRQIGEREFTNWAWHTSADHIKGGELVDVTPEQFGVEAICFCIGEWAIQWHPGHPDAVTEWQWVVVGTTDWNRKACKAGWLKSECLGEAFPVEA